MSEYVETIVIGGGQAGLSASSHLKKAGREHLVLDRGRIGDTWRHRWDSFCLVSQNWLCRLPEFPYDGDDPDGFMLRDQIDYLFSRALMLLVVFFALLFAYRIAANRWLKRAA